MKVQFPNLEEEDLLNKRKEGRTQMPKKKDSHTKKEVRELIRIWNHMSWRGEFQNLLRYAKDCRKPDKKDLKPGLGGNWCG